MIELEATSVIGAGLYERNEERKTERNGTRPRTLTTTTGDVQLRIPKLRKGSFFPSILNPRRRIDQRSCTRWWCMRTRWLVPAHEDFLHWFTRASGVRKRGAPRWDPAPRRWRAYAHPHRTPRRYGSGVQSSPVRLLAAWCCIVLCLLLLVAAMIAGSVAAEAFLDSSLVGHVSTALSVGVIFIAGPRIKHGVYGILGLEPDDTDEPDAAAPR